MNRRGASLIERLHLWEPLIVPYPVVVDDVNNPFFSFVQSTTTGYGDMTPKTHFGRFVASSCMLMGSLLMGLMTATLSRKIALNEREASLMKTLEEVVSVVLFILIFTSNVLVIENNVLVKMRTNKTTHAAMLWKK